MHLKQAVDFVKKASVAQNRTCAALKQHSADSKPGRAVSRGNKMINIAFIRAVMTSFNRV